MIFNIKTISLNKSLGVWAREAKKFIEEFHEIKEDNYELLFVKMDEIKQLMPLPKDSASKKFQNYQLARAAYNEAYQVIVDKIREILGTNFAVGAHDKVASFGYVKSSIPVEAAKRIALFSHVPFKIDLILKALAHDDTGVIEIGIEEYDKLSSEVRSNKNNFSEPVKKQINSIIENFK